jgi:signal transduction histidine kinase
MVSAVLQYLPRGNTLSDEAWSRRHLLLQWLLLAHVPGLFIFGIARGVGVQEVAGTVAVPFACLVIARLMRTRRLASFFITAGLVYCSAALVALSDGSIEAHFHFFIMIGFIALYQDWVPFLWNIIFTVLSHGFGSAFRSDLIFDHHAGIAHPWTWSLIHGVAVLAACIGVVLFWKQTEDEQQKTLVLREELAQTEISRRRFTSDLLVNLARRNQNLLYRQLDLLNQLEENERDPDALSDLFRLDHLATRIRRNAESLLVLSGEEPARKWGRPVLLADVIRAAIAETEDLDRVDFAVDESLAVSGRAVSDLTHLLAELIENAVHFSPPGVTVMLRTRPYGHGRGAHVLTIEDWGVGMSPEEIAEANSLLAAPRDVDLSVSQRLGLHVVARLAHRYGLMVSLTPTPGGGVTAVVVLPAVLFDLSDAEDMDFPPSWRTPETPAALVSPGATAEPFGRAIAYAPPAQPAAPLPSRPAAPVPTGPVPTGSLPTGSLPTGSLPTGSLPTGSLMAPFGRPPVEPFAPSTGLSDDWHAWWTPHQRANGHVTGTGALSDFAPHHQPPPPAPPLPQRPPEQYGPGNGSPRRDDPTGGSPSGPPGPTGSPPPVARGYGMGSSGRTGEASMPSRPMFDPTLPLEPRQPAAPERPATRADNGDAGPDAGTTRAADGASTSGASRTDSPSAGASSGASGAVGAPTTGSTTSQPGAVGSTGAVSAGGGVPYGSGGAPGPAGGGSTAAGTPGAGRPQQPVEQGRLPADEAEPAGSAGAGAEADGPRLNRRVPQANLAEGLRRQQEPAADQPQLIRDPAQAREALSRFQASQRAARAMLDDGSTDGPGTADESGGLADRGD